MMRLLSRTFFGGLVTIVPIILTVYFLWWLGSAAELGLGRLLALGLPTRFYLPGMGLFLGLVLVFATGIITRVWFMRRLLALAEGLVHRIPLVGTIYRSLKDLMAFVGGQKKPGVRAVTVAVGDTGLRLLGLLTRESAAHMTADERDRSVAAVYLPMSYALGGFMVLVPKESLSPLPMSAEDMLRVALTAGMSAENADSGTASVSPR